MYNVYLYEDYSIEDFSFNLFNICILTLPEESDHERMPTPDREESGREHTPPVDQWDCGDQNSVYDDPDMYN